MSKSNDLIGIRKAAIILDVPISDARLMLETADREIKLSNGRMQKYYYKDRVEYVKTLQTVKKRVDKNDDPEKQMIDTTEVFRGRICNYPGCKTQVGTGFYVCPEHREWFKNKQENYFEEDYEVLSANYNG